MLSVGFQGGGKLVGEYVDNRDSHDQEIYNRLAEHYFEPEQLKYISSLLNVPIKALKYDAREAQVLASRGHKRFLQGNAEGDATNKVGFPILQFYDFVLTIDNLMAFLRNLDIRVKNIQPFGEILDLESLKQDILPSSFIPWSFVEFLKDSANYFNDTSMFKLGAANKFTNEWDENTNVYNGAALKGEWDKCVEEAFMLNNRVLQIITALSQGLFIVHETQATKLQYDNVLFSNEQIPTGNWINQYALTGTYNYPNNPLLPDGVTIDEIPQYANYVLLPKITDMDMYQHNFLQQTYQTLIGKETPSPEFGKVLNVSKYIEAERTREISKIKFRFTLYKNIGGPIGMSNVLLTDGNYQLIPKANEGSKVGYASDVSKLSESFTNCVSKNDMKFIHKAYETYSGSTPGLNSHPIFACSKLARAFAAVGINQLLLNMYHRIQLEFDTRIKQTMQGKSTSNIRETVQMSYSGTNNLRVQNCPQNALPRYYDYAGNVIDPDKATFVHNGIKWLKSNVDPSKSECVPMVKAPDIIMPRDIKGVIGPTARGPMTRPGGAMYANQGEIQRLLRSQIDVHDTSPDTFDNPRVFRSLLASAENVQEDVKSTCPHCQQPIFQDIPEPRDSERRHIAFSAPIDTRKIISYPVKNSRKKRDNESRYKIVTRETASGHKQRYYVLQ